jgi:type IV pilus assembly protein PilB
MKLKPEELRDLLISHNILTKEKFDELEKNAQQNNEPIEELLYTKKLITDYDFAKLYADFLKIPFVDLSKETLSKDLLQKLPERAAKKYNAIIFGEEGGKLKIAMADPDNVEAVQFIEKQVGYNIKIFLATQANVTTALEQYKEGLGAEISKAIKETEEEVSIDKEEIDKDAKANDVEAIISEAPIARAVNILIEYAIKSRASDIHIEPREGYVQIRYRIDGILRDTMTLPKALMASIISRIKILSNLRIDEHRIPQDGRIKIKVAGQTVSIRVSTLPVMDGEKIVMRLLDETAKAQTLDELGFKGQAKITIERALKKPHGMLLVTGPTGSGKSTTLYSIISAMNNIGINISTVEDPVEYRIAGVNQTQVNPKVGMTFASGLRALLRQDPNVIMVGEIRDSETAEIAVHSALTGHVVLSTLHTNNAAGCLPRLLDMNVEPFLIASTVNAVVGQRLVRKLCPYCKEAFTPANDVINDIIDNFGLRKEFLLYDTPKKEVKAKEPPKEEDIKEELGGERKIPIPHQIEVEKKSIIEKIMSDPAMVNRSAQEAEEIALRNQVFINEVEVEKDDKEPKKEEPKGSLNLTLYRGVGCNKCDNSGYLGRLGIYEVIEVDDDIGKQIINHASTSEIQHAAVKNGMITMQQDGFLKALEGVTTVEEVLRVTKE